jgi:hypothetical protein
MIALCYPLPRSIQPGNREGAMIKVAATFLGILGIKSGENERTTPNSNLIPMSHPKNEQREQEKI